jgi:hypothetical protein
MPPSGVLSKPSQPWHECREIVPIEINFTADQCPVFAPLPVSLSLFLTSRL